MHAETGDTWRSPLARRFRADTCARVLGLWADRDALLACMDALPAVFGHGDFHLRNLLLPPDHDEVVAIDWAFCGPAPVGADLADLVCGAAWFCDIEVAEIPAVENAAFAAFEDGLRTAGWHGDPRLVRLGYAAAFALRAGACMPGWAAGLLEPERASSSELLFGRSAEDILAAWIALEEVCLQRADEARALAPELGLGQQ